MPNYAFQGVHCSCSGVFAKVCMSGSKALTEAEESEVHNCIPPSNVKNLLLRVCEDRTQPGKQPAPNRFGPPFALFM